jgi:hypothetical protein
MLLDQEAIELLIGSFPVTLFSLLLVLLQQSAFSQKRHRLVASLPNPSIAGRSNRVNLFDEVAGTGRSASGASGYLSLRWSSVRRKQSRRTGGGLNREVDPPSQ